MKCKYYLLYPDIQFGTIHKFKAAQHKTSGYLINTLIVLELQIEAFQVKAEI